MTDAVLSSHTGVKDRIGLGGQGWLANSTTLILLAPYCQLSHFLRLVRHERALPALVGLFVTNPQNGKIGLTSATWITETRRE
jgi:hypothetical protein